MKCAVVVVVVVRVVVIVVIIIIIVLQVMMPASMLVVTMTMSVASLTSGRLAPGGGSAHRSIQRLFNLLVCINSAECQFKR